MFESVFGALVCLAAWTVLSGGIAYFLARAFFGPPKGLDEDNDVL
jgi:hypothetical protein